MKCIKKTESSIEEVADYLKKGKITVLPTDTVYGFSGIVDTNKSVNLFSTDVAIRSIKGRSEFKPLIQLISDPRDILLYTDDVIPQKLLDKWPGPLTIIVNIKKNSPLSSDYNTVAFRCPGDEWLRNVIRSLNAPIYSTSVNRSGESVLGRIEDIKNEFGDDVDLIVEDGDKLNGVPSTIVSIENNNIKVLRQGKVTI